ncbi:MAG TPA: RHS repeat-associated core domain-containing protein [Luteibacter sp.]|nr:RHS repeat-associated core domain-containing protein [Luteibacter sp.]
MTYYYTDAQGTALATADAQGNLVTTADYRPYGEQALGTATAGPAYTGHVNDADTGLVYMQQRYYDPEIGRFESIDSVRPDAGNYFEFNRFSYVEDNPINRVDQDGRLSETVDFEDSDLVRAPSQRHGDLIDRHSSMDDCALCLSEKSSKKKRSSKPVHGPALSYDEVMAIIKQNNNSGQSAELVIAMAWKESNFIPDAKSSSSSATGLLMVTRPAAAEVGAKFSDMTNPAKNIAAGTAYLSLRITWAHGNVASGLDGYGTGSGYSGDIINAASQLQASPGDHDEILDSIHE